MSELLEIRNLSLAFGGLKALTNFSLTLPRGALHGLIGPNGAGKTTVFNLLTGVYSPQSGSIRLQGQALQGGWPHQIARAGVARTFQNIRLFANLSVLDNVRVACHLRSSHSVWAALWGSRQHHGEERAIREYAMHLLELMGLIHRRAELARHLPYGEQRLLEIARAMATGPKLLLLDEPAAGMNRSEKESLMQLIARLREQFGVTVLLIEHDMSLVMSICERLTVLDHGSVIAEDEPAQIQRNTRVIEAYLGVRPTEAENI